MLDQAPGVEYGGLIGDAMGAPAEGKTYEEIAATYGELVDFAGAVRVMVRKRPSTDKLGAALP